MVWICRDGAWGKCLLNKICDWPEFKDVTPPAGCEHSLRELQKKVRPEGVKEYTGIKIRMTRTVRPDHLFLAKPGTALKGDQVWDAVSNLNGAIAGICQNGERLGVKPGEFKFIDAPIPVLTLWDLAKGWCPHCGWTELVPIDVWEWSIASGHHPLTCGSGKCPSHTALVRILDEVLP